MFEYTMERLFSYTASLEMPPETIGPVPGGVRVNVYITGGEVEGPKLRGKLRPVGADKLWRIEKGGRSPRGIHTSEARLDKKNWDRKTHSEKEKT